MTRDEALQAAARHKKASDAAIDEDADLYDEAALVLFPGLTTAVGAGLHGAAAGHYDAYEAYLKLADRLEPEE